jgi:hypothetical protein
MELLIKKFTDTVEVLELPVEKLEKYKNDLVGLIMLAYCTKILGTYSDEQIKELKEGGGENIERLIHLFKEKNEEFLALYPNTSIESVGMPIVEDYLKTVFSL